MTKAEARRRAIRKKYRDKLKSGEWAYNDRYDSYFDTATRQWVESPCGDRTCNFCAKRPPLAPRSRKPVDKRNQGT